MEVAAAQASGVLDAVGLGTLLNAAVLLVNAGIAWGSWRAHRSEREKVQEQLRTRVGDLEDEGSVATRKEIEQLRSDVDRIDGYLEPLIQERLREGRVVKFGDGGEDPPEEEE